MAGKAQTEPVLKQGVIVAIALVGLIPNGTFTEAYCGVYVDQSALERLLIA